MVPSEPASRSIGESGVVDVLPDLVVVAFAAVSHLADPWLLFGLLALVYWLGDDRITDHPRHAGATAIALVACAYAAVALGKAAFAAPRPPAAGTVVAGDVPGWLPTVLVGWFEGQLVSDGFGFPSGHATGAAAAYGSLALLLNRIGTLRTRLTVAGIVAVAVSISRVVIEVHYLVDVVGGALLGAGVVVAGLWLAGDDRFRRRRPESRPAPDPRPVFLLAAAVSVVAAVVAFGGGHTDEVVEAGIGIGTGAGGALGWILVNGSTSDRMGSPIQRTVPLRLTAPALVATGGVWVGAFLLSGAVVDGTTASAVTTTAATGVAVVAVIAMPRLTGRFAR